MPTDIPTPQQLHRARHLVAFINGEQSILNRLGIVSVVLDEETRQVVWNTLYGPSEMGVQELLDRYRLT